MEKYTVEWKTLNVVTDVPMLFLETGAKRYVSDEYYIWKGRRHIFSSIYSADEWHLVRKSDKECIHSAKTAKECKGALEYLLKTGRKVGGSNITFNEDFTSYEFKRSARSLRAEARRNAEAKRRAEARRREREHE